MEGSRSGGGNETSPSIEDMYQLNRVLCAGNMVTSAIPPARGIENSKGINTSATLATKPSESGTKCHELKQHEALR